ncbi:MAG: hypothetical protein ACI841_001338 [Planctomycetota bacterium]|jgi:hypothetical protein
MNKNTALTLVALTGLSSACLIPSATVQAHLANYEASGHVAAVTEADNLSASDEASLSDLGLGGSETAVGARADLSWLGFHVSASTLDTSFSGDGTIDTDITLGGSTVTTGSAVNSSLDVSALSAAITWDLPIPIFDFGLGIGATQLDLDVDIDPGAASSIGTEVSEVIPLGVVRAGFSLAGFEIGATLGLISVDVGDLNGSVTDLDLNASYGLIGGDERLRGAVVLGYRHFEVQSEYDDGNSEVDVDFTIAGPYIGVSVSF